MISQRNKIKEKKQKILSKKLIMLKRQRRPIRDLNKFKMNNFQGSENDIMSKISLLEDEFYT